MEIWLDTVNLSLIEKATRMGILFGVTTNPTLIAQSGMVLEDLLEKICGCQRGPVAVYVTAFDAKTIIQQAEALFKFSKQIIVAIPTTGAGLEAIHECSKQKIPTMAAGVFDQNQLLLASSAGATYIATYISWICEDDMNGFESIRSMLHFMNLYNNPLRLLATSLRTAEQVKECAQIGAHAVTISDQVFKDLIEDHPMTLQSIGLFHQDWASAEKRRFLPL